MIATLDYFFLEDYEETEEERAMKKAKEEEILADWFSDSEEDDIGPPTSTPTTNSALNTPIMSTRSTTDTFSIDPDDALDAINDDMESVISASGYGGHQVSSSLPGPMITMPTKICGIDIELIEELNRDEVYDQRSVILYDLELLEKAFVQKMGKEFCLNAAGTILFMAGMQDKGCTLSGEQFDVIWLKGMEQILPMTDWDLPRAIAQWIVWDETGEDKTSYELRDADDWAANKDKLPTYLKHEMVAFIFGETYFDLTDLYRGNKERKVTRKRKKGEPVIHRNANFLASAVEELHNFNLPKKKYVALIRAFTWANYGDVFIKLSIAKPLFYVISFFMPVSERSPDPNTGELEVKSLVLDRTYQPEKMSANEGYNEYDNMRILRTGTKRLCCHHLFSKTVFFCH